MVKDGCKWCEMGECWTHGADKVKGPGVTKKGQPGGSWSKGAGGAAPQMMGGGKGSQMMAMMQMMMMGKGGCGKGGCGKGGGAAGCKWCQMGECWTHQGADGGGKGGGASTTKEQINGLNVEPATSDEVELFLALYSDIQPHGHERLKGMHPKLQKLIIEMGDMSDAKDQTAVLMGRVKIVNSLRPGAWVCPACVDIQFPKNDQCRKCGTPKA